MVSEGNAPVLIQNDWFLQDSELLVLFVFAIMETWFSVHQRETRIFIRINILILNSYCKL